MTGSERKRLIRRLADVHGWYCWYCHLPVGPGKCHVDHIIAKSMGGEDDFFNFALACRQCNMAKGTLTVGEFLEWLAFVRSPRSRSLIGQKYGYVSADSQFFD